MNPERLTDPVVRGIVCGMAREMARGRFEACDLAGAAFVRILEAEEPERIENPRAYFKILSRWAMGDHIRAESRKAPRSTQSLDELNEEYGLARFDYPEPSPGLLALVAELTDLEAEVITLACGLDGAPGRGFKRVAYMTGRDFGNTRKRLNRGLDKLRTAIDRRAGAHVLLEGDE